MGHRVSVYQLYYLSRSAGMDFGVRIHFLSSFGRAMDYYFVDACLCNGLLRYVCVPGVRSRVRERSPNRDLHDEPTTRASAAGKALSFNLFLPLSLPLSLHLSHHTLIVACKECYGSAISLSLSLSLFLSLVRFLSLSLALSSSLPSSLPPFVSFTHSCSLARALSLPLSVSPSLVRHLNASTCARSAAA